MSATVCNRRREVTAVRGEVASVQAGLAVRRWLLSHSGGSMCVKPARWHRLTLDSRVGPFRVRRCSRLAAMVAERDC
jgi:hypothetical protein